MINYYYTCDTYDEMMANPSFFPTGSTIILNSNGAAYNMLAAGFVIKPIAEPGTAAWGTISGNINLQLDLQTQFNTKASSSHAHVIADVTGLQPALNNKSETTHNHNASYEPINSNIQAHILSVHAPTNAQKNSDITLAEIEAKLVGVLTSHSHPGGGGGLSQPEVLKLMTFRI